MALAAGAALSGAADRPPVSQRQPAADPDLSDAVPASQISKLPSTGAQIKTLQSQIAGQKPAVADARQTRDSLAQQAQNLHRNLVTTAAEIQQLETDKLRLDKEIPHLTAEDGALTAGLARDRAKLTRLIALLEKLQRDLPPAMVMKSGDALAAARAADMMGTALPGIYRRAAALAKRIEHIRAVRQALISRRKQAAENTIRLNRARDDLATLLAERQTEAAAAAAQYDTLKTQLDTAAGKAANLQMLLDETASLRGTPAARGIVTVTAADGDAGASRRLHMPVAGTAKPGGMAGVGGDAAPGETFATLAGAQVVAPADATVLFAGPYQHRGQVLILELATGYDAVLAGLGRIDVRLGNRVLAGEPVGVMPSGGGTARLYMELRRGGRGVSPAPFLMTGSRKAKTP